MWPKDFKFFRNFMDSMRTIFIFNTIKNYPRGLTYYDLKKFGNIPHSKIYRMMKSLKEEGYLVRKDDTSKETGRPKHLYFLSEQGELKLKELRENIGEIFDWLILRFPDEIPEFDHKKFLECATFQVWASPVEYVMCKEISDEDKFQALTELESDVNNILSKIRKEKNHLQNKIKNNQENSA
ncbi:MAG: PadR family transcriptional regulator [Promethearchaeota archaeon]|nr:MAG: PadR family transcriptional regulator [Candidatus Lokiarchaeota archaeon]